MKDLIFSALYLSKQLSAMSTKETSGNSLQLPKSDKKGIRLLTSELRKELKKPQGLLIDGHFKETMKRLKEFIEEEKPSLIISVGDVVSRNMIEYGFQPNVVIVDNKVMRKPIQPITVNADQTLYAKNPPGTITNEACTAIKTAFKQEGRIRLMIDGEEDLLTLPVVLVAPENAVVVYGQPHNGIVVIKVTEEKKVKIRHIVDSMEETSKS